MVEPIVAIVVGLMLHVPPVVEVLTVIVEPAHTLVGPTIGAAADTTVTTIVTLHPATR